MAKKKVSKTKKEIVSKDLDCCASNMDLRDVQFVKLSTASAVLFLLGVWPALNTLVSRVHWGWYLAAMLIFMLRPMNKILSCKCKKN
jgi:uncharacterized membrane protein YiaA